MKDLKNTIKDNIYESYSNGILDKSIKTPEKRKVQNAIYKELEKTGVTGRFYRDTSWEGVKLVRQTITNALDKIKNAEHEYEVSIAPDEGGYRKSKDGMSQWKQYKVEIYVKGAEEPFMVGTLNCHAAGTTEDPFSMYDMSCCVGY